jgi:hypothetical protein
MYHLPTKAVFEIVTDRSQAVLGGLPVFGFAVRLLYVCQDGKTSPTTLKNSPLSAIRRLSLFSVKRPQ